MRHLKLALLRQSSKRVLLSSMIDQSIERVVATSKQSNMLQENDNLQFANRYLLALFDRLEFGL
jgi:hypothetical protein